MAILIPTRIIPGCLLGGLFGGVGLFCSAAVSIFLAEHRFVAALNKHILGAHVSIQVRSQDQDGALVGRLQLEGVRFRGKRKRV